MREMRDEHGGLRQEKVGLGQGMDKELETMIRFHLERGDRLQRDVIDLQGRFDDWLMQETFDYGSIDLEAKLMCDLMKATSSLAENHRMLSNLIRKQRAFGGISQTHEDEVNKGAPHAD